MASTLSVERHPKSCGCGHMRALDQNLPQYFLDAADEAMLALAQSHLRTHAATLRKHYPKGFMIPCHRKTGDKGRPFGCPAPLCSSVFGRGEAYRRHYFGHIPHFVITCCGRKYSEKRALLEHHMTNHLATVTTVRFPCSVSGCTYTSQTTLYIKRHMRRAHPELCTKIVKARKARREEAWPYPPPVVQAPVRRIVKHPSATGAPTSAALPPTNAFRLSSLLPPWIAAKPPVIPTSTKDGQPVTSGAADNHMAEPPPTTTFELSKLLPKWLVPSRPLPPWMVPSAAVTQMLSLSSGRMSRRGSTASISASGWSIGSVAESCASVCDDDGSAVTDMVGDA